LQHFLTNCENQRRQNLFLHLSTEEKKKEVLPFSEARVKIVTTGIRQLDLSSRRDQQIVGFKSNVNDLVDLKEATHLLHRKYCYNMWPVSERVGICKGKRMQNKKHYQWDWTFSHRKFSQKVETTNRKRQESYLCIQHDYKNTEDTDNLQYIFRISTIPFWIMLVPKKEEYVTQSEYGTWACKVPIETYCFPSTPTTRIRPSILQF